MKICTVAVSSAVRPAQDRPGGHVVRSRRAKRCQRNDQPGTPPSSSVPSRRAAFAPHLQILRYISRYFHVPKRRVTIFQCTARFWEDSMPFNYDRDFDMRHVLFLLPRLTCTKMYQMYQPTEGRQKRPIDRSSTARATPMPATAAMQRLLVACTDFPPPTAYAMPAVPVPPHETLKMTLNSLLFGCYCSLAQAMLNCAANWLVGSGRPARSCAENTTTHVHFEKKLRHYRAPVRAGDAGRCKSRPKPLMVLAVMIADAATNRCAGAKAKVEEAKARSCLRSVRRPMRFCVRLFGE